MDPLRYEKRGEIAWLTLDRPQAANALDDDLNAALDAAWADFERDDTLKVAVLTGAGKVFCAGADLKTFIPKWAAATLGEARQSFDKGIGGGLTRGRHRMSKPVIAAINGAALGGGFELALACDIRIAAESAKVGVFEVRQGLHQGDGGLVRLLAVAGLGVALDLTLSGREVLAPEALALRLVSRVVPATDLLTTAEAMATMIAGNSQRAVRSAKATALDLIGRQLDDALRIETFNAYSCPGDYAEVRARSAAFLARNKP
jgi:enoyl-CoA hydratase